MDLFGDSTIFNIVISFLALTFDNVLIIIKIFFFIMWKLCMFLYKIYLLIIENNHNWAIVYSFIVGVTWKFFLFRLFISWRTASINHTFTGIGKHDWRREDFKKRYSQSGQEEFDDVLFDPQALSRSMKEIEEAKRFKGMTETEILLQQELDREWDLKIRDDKAASERKTAVFLDRFKQKRKMGHLERWLRMIDGTLKQVESDDEKADKKATI